MRDREKFFVQTRDETSRHVVHPVLQVALEAATRGGLALATFFRENVSVTAKGVGNFVSSADLAAEKAIVDCLLQSFPKHAIISEESHSDREDSKHLWIIDPLDGTNNFLHGIPHFAVSIAYLHNGQPELGIVCNPITCEWYVAVRGQGAWHEGVRQSVSSATSLSESMIACGFYYDRGAMMQATLATLADLFRTKIHGMRRMGAAALDLAYLACGRFESFFEYRLSPWDYAAGLLLVHEAGGRMTDCLGQPPPFGRASSICASNGALHDTMLTVVSPHFRAI